MARKKILNKIADEVKLHNDIWPDINLLKGRCTLRTGYCLFVLR
jgi:hypothetical protein